MVRFTIAALVALLTFGEARAEGPATGTPEAPEAPPAASKQGLLDGNAFDVTLKPSVPGQKGGSAQESALVFEDGTVRADSFAAQGFGAAPYAATRLPDGTLSFSASQRSGANGTLTWNGSIDAEGELHGTAVWARPGSAPVTYTLDGEPGAPPAETPTPAPPSTDAPTNPPR
jgi:hypothetical protein